MRKINRLFAGRVALLGATLVGGLSLVNPAKGALVLSFSDGVDPVQYAPAATTNNGISQTSLTSTLFFPSFSIDIASAISNATSTSGVQGYLETNTIRVTDNNTSGNPVTLTITASDTGWTIPGNSGNTLLLGSALGGSVTKLTANGIDSVSFSSTLSTNGGATSQSTLPQVSSIVVPSPNPQGFNVPNASFLIARTGTYDLSNVAVVSLSNSGDQFNISGTTSVTVVPEPASCAMLLLGSSSLLLRRYRRRSV